jgi:methionine synthase II (cobalamin-independent)
MKVRIGNPRRKWKLRDIVVVHDYDTWNLSQTLAAIIAPALKRYVEVSDRYIEIDEPRFSNGMTKRQAVVECAWAFQEIATEAEADSIYAAKLTDTATCEKLDELEERMQRALELFAEIYKTLWN